eukprot:CAMPEP_0202887016 /NCGR_PEP_ID=MMETSP1391-20130828/42466_1 /ASSEMBLY_ACC=CAM_ASM_000867 /TAXON_ID=1034604 /ORGANISM="Chlamydomonas leiostraca, Strain SAG 11-49" /LENGTH=54 /DNA_ID=CAMNT_0049570291 /DNA_START=670 /DNA_END=830 /DNA_ORIENTATION=+
MQHTAECVAVQQQQARQAELRHHLTRHSRRCFLPAPRQQPDAEVLTPRIRLEDV